MVGAMLNWMPCAAEPSIWRAVLGFSAVTQKSFAALLRFLCAKPVIATAIASDMNKTFFMMLFVLISNYCYCDKFCYLGCKYKHFGKNKA